MARPGLSPLVDRDGLRGITRRLNGGFNGLADRQAKLIQVKAALQGRSDATAVTEIQAWASEAKRSATRSATGAAGTATVGTAATVVPKLETLASGSPIAAGIVIVLVLRVAFLFLGYRAWAQTRDARAFAANAAQRAGE